MAMALVALVFDPAPCRAQVPNPAYVGPWSAPLRDNPAYHPEPTLGQLDDVGVLAFELWQVAAAAAVGGGVVTGAAGTEGAAAAANGVGAGAGAGAGVTVVNPSATRSTHAQATTPRRPRLVWTPSSNA